MRRLEVDKLPKVDDFLSTYSSKATRRDYRNGIKKFEEYLDGSIENLLDREGNLGRIIEKHFVWLKEQGYKQNSARVYTNGPVQFLKYYGAKVQIRRSVGISEPKSAPETIAWSLMILERCMK